MAAFIRFHVQSNVDNSPIGGALIETTSDFGPWQALTNACGDFFTPAPGLAPGVYHAKISKPGYTTETREWSLGGPGEVLVGLTPGAGPVGPVPPLPHVIPNRETMLEGKFRFQGLNVTLPRFGQMPWWGACWMWLTEEERRQAAAQLLQQGMEILDIEVPSGRALYDEAGQFYSADRFPAIDPSWDEIGNAIAFAISYGFKGVWLFLGGDDGQAGYPIATQQVKDAGAAFSVHPAGDVRGFVVPLPGYDGVWHKPNSGGTGYNPDQIRQWSLDARAAGFNTVGIEGGVGYLLCGEGGANYAPGGNMSGYDLILSEFNDGQFETGDFWQILARYLGPLYVMPAAQKQHIANGPSDPLYPEANDPHPEFVLRSLNERGLPYVHRAFEYGLYGFVRNTPASTIALWRQQFVAVGNPDHLVC